MKEFMAFHCWFYVHYIRVNPDIFSPFGPIYSGSAIQSKQSYEISIFLYESRMAVIINGMGSWNYQFL
jgi:hypothetical protein